VYLLKPLEEMFWKSYLASVPQNKQPQAPIVQASISGSIESANTLLNLYLSGQKTAGSSLLEDYTFNNEPLPKINNYWIILDDKNRPRCIVKTIRIEHNKFMDVPAEVAFAEGEGDLSLEFWQKEHHAFFEPFLSQWGLNNIEEATFITEFYEVVFR
jgi:uncharacterized protein YhfF